MPNLTPDLGDVNDAADKWNAAWLDDDPICLCDAYRVDLRPGRCPVHGRP